MDITRLLFLNELEKLNLPNDDFAIFGSAPLVIRNIKETNKDLDIIVKKSLWNELIKKYPVTIQVVENKQYEFIIIGNIELSYTLIGVNGINPKTIVDKADIISGYRFVKLEDVKFCKLCWNRDKDINDIKLIDQYLNKYS